MKIITKNIPTKFIKIGKLEILLEDFEQTLEDIKHGVYTDKNELTKELVKLKVLEYDKEYDCHNSGENSEFFYDRFYNLLGSV